MAVDTELSGHDLEIQQVSSVCQEQKNMVLLLPQRS